MSGSSANLRGAERYFLKKPCHFLERPKKERTELMVECGKVGKKE